MATRPFNQAAAHRARMTQEELRGAVDEYIERRRIALPEDPAQHREVLCKIVLLVMGERYDQECALDEMV